MTACGGLGADGRVSALWAGSEAACRGAPWPVDDVAPPKRPRAGGEPASGAPPASTTPHPTVEARGGGSDPCMVRNFTPPPISWLPRPRHRLPTWQQRQARAATPARRAPPRPWRWMCTPTSRSAAPSPSLPPPRRRATTLPHPPRCRSHSRMRRGWCAAATGRRSAVCRSPSPPPPRRRTGATCSTWVSGFRRRGMAAAPASDAAAE